MSGGIVGVGLVVAQREHGPPAGAHLILLAGAVVAALVVLAVRWWRGRREPAAPEQQSPSHDRSAENGRSTEDE